VIKKPEDSQQKRALGENDPKRVERGKDMYGYGEQKTHLNLTLTPTAIALISDLAKQLGLSRSETIEQLFRNHSKAIKKILKVK